MIAHLNPNDDLIELVDDINEIDNVEDSFEENDELTIDKVLNLDANVFVKNLDKIIDDSEDISMEEELYYDIQDTDRPENEIDVEWDSIAEADEIVNTI